jgi:type IV pilus assembly protein PilC
MVASASQTRRSARETLPMTWLSGLIGSPKPLRWGVTSRRTVPRLALTFILRNLATLVENGVPLPQALATLARERSIRKHAGVLDAVRKSIESGEPFSAALRQFPNTFDDLVIHQIRVAERAGTLAATLHRLTDQLEKGSQLRAQILKKLAYPMVLMVAGCAAVTFMLMFVIPVFQETYAESKIPLPAITQAMIAASEIISSYAWLAPLGLAAGVLVWKQLRANAALALVIDRAVLRVPLVGNWLRDLAVLQFMDVLGNLLDSGFTVHEALGASSGSVGNLAVRHSIQELQQAIACGERFSRELDKQGTLFPPVASQLVMIGEKTGKLSKSVSHVREHLHREIERTTSAIVGVIEPVLTISLAVAIGVILLAVYLPMFDMIGAMNVQR